MMINRVQPEVDTMELTQRALQSMVNKFGWEPSWQWEEMQQEILAVVQMPSAPTAELERAALRCYCARWYAACRSTNPEHQHQAFMALHAYLFKKAIEVSIRRYQVAPAYAQQIAEDSAQEATFTIWQKLHQLQEPGNFLGWAKLIVTRVVLAKLKQEIDNPSLDAEDAVEMEDMRSTAVTTVQESQEKTPEETQDEAQDEAQRQVEAVIQRCLKKVAHQQVIIENLLRNKTLNQIAELLGRTPNNVRQIKHRALEQLRKCEEMRKLMNNQASQGQSQSQDKSKSLSHLFEALEDVEDKTLDCATIETWLPSYIDDELAGEDVAAKYPAIKRHLDLCAACERLYVELVELARAEQADVAPVQVIVPTPNLSFLPPRPSFVALARQLVNIVAEKALNVLAPQALLDFSTLGDFFFKRLDALGGMLPVQRASVATLGDEDPSDAVLTTLTVAYLTTRQIAQTISRQVLQAQQAQGGLRTTLIQTAQQLAAENGMEAAEAQAFAQIYADEAEQATETWLALIERLR